MLFRQKKTQRFKRQKKIIDFSRRSLKIVGSNIFSEFYPLKKKINEGFVF